MEFGVELANEFRRKKKKEEEVKAQLAYISSIQCGRSCNKNASFSEISFPTFSSLEKCR